MSEINRTDEAWSWLVKYAKSVKDRAATWHILCNQQENSLHNEGDWMLCKHVSCVRNREYVETFERLEIL